MGAKRPDPPHHGSNGHVVPSSCVTSTRAGSALLEEVFFENCPVEGLTNSYGYVD